MAPGERPQPFWKPDGTQETEPLLTAAGKKLDEPRWSLSQVLGAWLSLRPGGLLSLERLGDPVRLDRLEDLGKQAAAVSARFGFAAWCSFMMVIVFFMFFFYHVPSLVIFNIAVGIFICLLGSALSALAGSMDNAFGLLLCAFAACAGVWIGGFNYTENVADYWAFGQHRQYSNVWPDEPAEAHRDASAIVFAEGAAPDARLFAAYVSDHGTYCVAPILSKYEPISQPNVQYWAVGLDCCGDSYQCNVKGRAGLVLYNKTDIFRAGKVPDLFYYKEAARMSTARFLFGTAPEPIFVNWVQDIDLARYDYWRHAMQLALEAAVVSVVPFFVLGLGAGSSMVAMAMVSNKEWLVARSVGV